MYRYRWNGDGQPIFVCPFIPIAAISGADAASSASLAETFNPARFPWLNHEFIDPSGFKAV